MESRINELEHLIRNAVIIDDENDEEGTVGRSSIVKIKNVETGDEVTYRLVGFTQSDPLAGKISDESRSSSANTWAMSSKSRPRRAKSASRSSKLQRRTKER